jgi:hypothetical protein
VRLNLFLTFSETVTPPFSQPILPDKTTHTQTLHLLDRTRYPPSHCPSLSNYARPNRPVIIMAAAKHQPPFRAEHIGSLLRPDSLLDARAKVRDGKSPEEANLGPIEKDAVAQIVKTQLDCGLRAVTCGM